MTTGRRTQEALAAARAAREEAARLREGLRTSLTPAADADRIQQCEATARHHESAVRATLRQTSP